MTGRNSTPAKNTPPRAWQRMLSGRRLDLLDPSPVDIEIDDIAHGARPRRSLEWPDSRSASFQCGATLHDR